MKYTHTPIRRINKKRKGPELHPYTRQKTGKRRNAGTRLRPHPGIHPPFPYTSPLLEKVRGGDYRKQQGVNWGAGCNRQTGGNFHGMS